MNTFSKQWRCWAGSVGLSLLFATTTYAATPPTKAPAQPATPPVAKPGPGESTPGPGHTACLKSGPAGMACIPGGKFLRGVKRDPNRKCFQFDRIKTPSSDAIGQHEVDVSTFYMDVHEVTYGDYDRCKKSGKCKGGGPRYPDMNADKQGFVGVTWYQAKAYCEAFGKRLPWEAEWEKAARGTKGDINPWGNEPADCDRAVIRNKKRRTSCGVRQKSKKPTIGRPFLVGSKPVGRYGLYDMVGNVEEWVADWYSLNWNRCGKACRGLDPKGPCGGAEKCKGHTHKVVRGGSWFWPKCAATGYHRRPHVPKNRPFHHFGFRCAASLEQAKALGSGSAR